MENKERKELLKRFIATLGEDNQLRMCIEEMSELTKEICKYWRMQVYNPELEDQVRKNIQEEVADVLICANQVKIMFGEEEVEKMIDYKLNRSAAYLPKDSNNKKN